MKGLPCGVTLFLYCFRNGRKISVSLHNFTDIMKRLLLLALGLMLAAQAFPQDKMPFVTLDNLQLNTRADFTLSVSLGVYEKKVVVECPALC